MKTKLFGKSNAIVAENNRTLTNVGEILGILACKGGDNVDISNKLSVMIKEHFMVEDGTEIKIISKEVLTNQKRVLFEAHWEEDGESRIRDLIIFIAPTY